jgi:putative oxidoreductase
MAHVDAGLVVLRVIFGLFMAYHGYNKFFGKGGLAGTARWFASIGMKWPIWQARMAATTEVGAGVLLAAGLLTPLAAAGLIGVMVVAISTSHLKVGFFVFLPNQGWEYCASIIAAALGVALIGPGRASIDHAIGWNWTAAHGWIGVIIAAAAGFGGGALQLATSYRPPKPAGAGDTAGGS